VRAQGIYTFINSPLGGATRYIIGSQEPYYIRHLSAEKDHLPFQVINVTGTEERESLIFVPLTLRGLSLGVLSIQHPLPNAYGQEDLFSLQLLANYFALALHNMRLYHNLNQLNETGQLLTQQLESEQTLQATVDKIRDATQADIVVLYPYEPALQHFVLPPRTAGELLNPTFPRASRLRPDDIATLASGLVEPIFARESITVYTQLDGDAVIRPGNFREREKISSSAVVPLRVGTESVGALFVNFRQPQRFDATQKLLIEGLAHYAAIAIKNSQVFGTLSLRRVGELEILQKIDRELTRTLELDTVLNTILKLAHERIPAGEASILLHNTRTHILETAVAIGRHAEASRKQVLSLQEMKGITRWVVDQKKSARVNNVHIEKPWHNLHVPVADDIVSELDVPLLDGDEVVGVLNFESTKEGAFQQEDQDFLQTLAGQAVLAIKNAQAYEREKRLAEEGRVLNQISKEIISQLDLNYVFDLILKKALELTNATSGNLMLYDRDKKDLWMAAEHGVVKEKKGWRQSLEEGVVGYVAKHKHMLNVDLSQPPWNDVNLDFIPGTRSELAVPMLVGNELHGVLNVESLSVNNFSESDERLLQGLADLAVIALQNAQAYDREKHFAAESLRLATESQVLNQISKEITSQLDTSHVFDLILNKALELTHSTLGSLHLYNSDLNELIMVAELGVAQSKKGLRQLLHQGIVGHVASQKQLLNVPDVSLPPWNKVFWEFFPGTKSELAAPMLAGKKIRGVLNVESTSPNHFSEKDERLLQGLADLAVVALQNAERYKQAQVEAQRFKLLYQAGQELGKITDLAQLEQAYDIVVRIAEEQSQSLVVIRRFDNDAQELNVVRASQLHYADLYRKSKLDSGINGQVAREHRTITLPDITNPPPGVATPQPSNPKTRSLLITPIIFEKQYYGNLGLDHEDVGHFQDADTLFFEGLAQQLAITIHRLETTKARQEFEQRVQSAELMSSIGQSAFEVTHRLGNDLGLVDSYITDIQSELERQRIVSTFLSRKLDSIRQAVKTVLSFSKDLRLKLAKLRDKEEMAGEPVLISPRVLLEEVSVVTILPSNIHIDLEIDEDVAHVHVIYSLVADILRNLVTNAIQAMPDGGTITLRGRNAGRYVALEVADTGIGIPQQKLSNVFDLFFSTRGSSGFGLWSARSNALKNRGDLKVESQPGQGTIFTLLLPKADIGIA
jgi:GAF domain-containing protein